MNVTAAIRILAKGTRSERERDEALHLVAAAVGERSTRGGGEQLVDWLASSNFTTKDTPEIIAAEWDSRG